MTFSRKLKDLLSLGAVNVGSSLIFSIFWLYLASISLKTEYGEIGFLVSIANVGVGISLIGLNTGIVVYESKQENVFPSAFLLGLISANITAAITFVLTENALVSILIVGVVTFSLISSGLNGHQRHRDFSKYKLIRAIITVIISIIGYYYLGIHGILIGYFIATLFILKEINSLMKNRKIEFSVLKPKFPLMLNAYAVRLTDVFLRYGDKLIIGSLFGFSILGSYYFAIQYLLVLLAIPQSLSTYLVPSESRGEKNKKIKLFSILISCIVTIVSVIIIPIGINTFLPKYEDSILAMQILSIGVIPYTISIIQESEFLGKEKGRVVLYGNSIQTGFYIISLILLGQLYGIVGFSIGFVFSVIIRVIFNVLNKKT